MTVVLRARSFLLFTFLFVVVLAACSHDPKKVIVGEWATSPAVETLHFFPDGTVTIKTKGSNVAGTYSFPDQTHLKLEMGGSGGLMGAIVAEFEISSDTLKLNNNGQIATYTRVK